MSDPDAEPRMRHAGEAVAAGAVGVVAGLAGAVVHRHAVRPGDVLLPWGLLLSLATVFAVILAAGRLVGARGAIGVGIGWVVVLLWLQQARAEGDYVFAADLMGNVYVFGGMLTVGLAVVRGMTGSASAARPRMDGPPA